MMQRILFGGLALLVAFALPALGAGKNSGGAMLVHTDDAHTWTLGACDLFDDWVPQDYSALNTRTDHDVNTSSLIWFIAAFHPSASPGVTVVYFGHDHNLPEFYHNRSGFCGPGGTLEVPDPGWPDAPATAGNSVAFGAPIVGDHLFPFYYFDVWGEPGWYYASGVNPVGGYAAFIDDSQPPREDEIDNFGRVEWLADGGYNDAPEEPTSGACCFADATCQFLQGPDCSTQGGIYGGDNIDCDPDPCGACCYWYKKPNATYERRCVVTTEPSCDYVGTQGVDQGYNFHKVVVNDEPLGSEWSYPGTMCAATVEEAPGRWWCFDPRYGDPVAACCANDGTCSAIPWSECTGDDTFWGYGTVCSPNPCPGGADPEGACCTYLGVCTVTLEAGCTGTQQWQGADTVCDPNPCIPFGVCCLPEEPYDQCTITTAADCQDPYIWNGAYDVCSVAACHETPTEPMSWGKLKTLYR